MNQVKAHMILHLQDSMHRIFRVPMLQRPCTLPLTHVTCKWNSLVQEPDNIGGTWANSPTPSKIELTTSNNNKRHPCNHNLNTTRTATLFRLPPLKS